MGIEPSMVTRPLRAVLFDRDGTLVKDVPYNGDPALVEPMPTARAATELLRRNGIAIGVITNQSGVARGLLSPADVAAVNERIDELLGPIDVWAICPHGAEEGCGCRKPAPGLVNRALRTLGLRAADAVVIGDIGADMGAARAAGAGGVLVPTPMTRLEEVRDAPLVAATVLAAVELVLAAEVVS